MTVRFCQLFGFILPSFCLALAYFSGVFTQSDDLFGNGRAYVGLAAGIHDRASNPQFAAAGSDLGAYYHIQATSPVSATGSMAWAPPLDIDGEVRLFGGNVSMGADEIAVTGSSIYLPLIWRRS